MINKLKARGILFLILYAGRCDSEWCVVIHVSRDSLAMLLYSRLFEWLVRALNENIEKNKKSPNREEGEEVFIGVLDIYGFECFESNSFEQFCINYANEKVRLSVLCRSRFMLTLLVRAIAPTTVQPTHLQVRATRVYQGGARLVLHRFQR